jgi:hypothetical protein
MSLLTSFSKIIEKLIYARLIIHIGANILTSVNNKVAVGGIFCDLQKAFDCVKHKILLDRLEFCGMESKFKTLIKSYLTGILIFK